MRLPKISNLYGRIFAIFWLTMLLVLLAALSVSNFDPRETHTIEPPRLKDLYRLAEFTEKRFAHYLSVDSAIRDLNQWRQRRGSGRDRDDDQPELYFTDLNGNLLGTMPRHMKSKAIQNFITLVEDTSEPKQKLYGQLMVAGPIPLNLAGQPVHMYISHKWHRPPPLLLLVLDRPFLLLLIVMVISTPLLLWLAWALSQPARRLERAARRVAKGEFVEDPDLERGSTEFREAGAAFNQMVTAVNKMISGQQRLLSDISHELRSPLTRLRMANALATRKQGESAELTRIDTEAERLEKMISELLELSRMQVNSHHEREIMTAEELWGDIAEDAKFEAEQVNKQLIYSAIPDCTLQGNPNLLMSAVENIIRNAIHYSQDRIQVTFTRQDCELLISVEDNGEGVPEDELEDIFRPFYRVSTARDRHSGGAGLGLAITESAVRQHSGTIKASRCDLGGLKLLIKLPLQNQADARPQKQ
ncbi:two-component system sensor histidine kinase CpxA [Vibrio albus]|uniref:histidine kinase n=1 Tax=Vibrio albus TaxID=2200953 RepID=A0A2U3BAH1_9VIBR|nr:envelope stress sensor histidine kinase CpxA [Vibrio albus]PWI33734.1 two-component system sensor histidine kinase CpxA [Vibrio albus]